MGRDHTLEFIYMTRWRLHGENVRLSHSLPVYLCAFARSCVDALVQESTYLCVCVCVCVFVCRFCIHSLPTRLYFYFMVKTLI